MDLSDILALILAALSLLVAGIGLIYARRAGQTAGRAEQRAERAEHRAERGQPSAQYLDFLSLDDEHGDRIQFRFRVTNVGAAGARHVTVHLSDGAGQAVARSSEVSLAAGQSAECTVLVLEAWRWSYPLNVGLQWYSWDAEKKKPFTHRSQAKIGNPIDPPNHVSTIK